MRFGSALAILWLYIIDVNRGIFKMPNKIKDITGQKFGHTTAIRPTDKRAGSSVVWECKCDCGNVHESSSSHLKSGSTNSCGCWRKKRAAQLGMEMAKDLKGQIFGRLTAIRPSGKRRNGNVLWECECICGNLVEVPARNLANGESRSCGCLKLDVLSETGKKNANKKFVFIEGTSISKIKSKKPSVNSKTGQRGVSFLETNGKYSAHIGFKKRKYSLGQFDTLEEATAARKKAEEMMYEPFLECYEKKS